MIFIKSNLRPGSLRRRITGRKKSASEKSREGTEEEELLNPPLGWPPSSRSPRYSPISPSSEPDPWLHHFIIFKHNENYLFYYFNTD